MSSLLCGTSRPNVGKGWDGIERQNPIRALAPFKKASSGQSQRASRRPIQLSRLIQRKGDLACCARPSTSTERHSSTARPEENDLLPIRIRTQHGVRYGEIIKIVGAGIALGDWNPNQAPGMTWAKGDEWSVELQVPPGTYDFKCVVTREDGSIAEWEPGDNRILDVPKREDISGELIEVVCPWSNTAATFMSFDEDDATARLEAHQGESIKVEESKGDGKNPAADLEGTDGEGLARLDAKEKVNKTPIEEKVDAVANAIQSGGNGKQGPSNGQSSVLKQNEEIVNRQPVQNGSHAKKDTPSVKQEPTSSAASTVPADAKIDENLQIASSPVERSTEETTTSTEGVQETSDVPSPTAAPPQEKKPTFAQGLAGLLGLLAVPIVLWSEYTLKQTGCGLPPGPEGYLGAAEGISYLTIAGLAASGIISKLTRGKGLPRGPGGLLGLAEGLSYLTIIMGSVVLGYQYKEYGYIPSALPDNRCYGEQASTSSSNFAWPSLPFSFTSNQAPSISSSWTNPFQRNLVFEASEADQEEPSGAVKQLADTVKGVKNLFVPGPQSPMEYLSSGAEDGLSGAELEPVVEELENAAAQISSFFKNIFEKFSTQKPAGVSFQSIPLQTAAWENLQTETSGDVMNQWDSVRCIDSFPEITSSRSMYGSEPFFRRVGMEFSIAANTAAQASHITQHLETDILQLDSAAAGVVESAQALQEASPSLTDAKLEEATTDLQGSLERAEESLNLSPSLDPVVEQLDTMADEVKRSGASRSEVGKVEGAEGLVAEVLQTDTSGIPEAEAAVSTLAESKAEDDAPLIEKSEKAVEAVVKTIGETKDLLDDAKEVLGSIAFEGQNNQENKQ